MFRLMRSMACVVAVLVWAAAARAQTFANPATIIFPASQAPNVYTATPYPSNISVVGGPTNISAISITLNNFQHSRPQEANVLLVSPSGQKIALMGSNGYRNGVSGLTLTFATGATATLSPNLLESGTYAPSAQSLGFSLPSPAPAAPYSNSLGTLAGANANGLWKLFVADITAGVSNGSIGGWSMTFNDTTTTPIATGFTYQGILKSGDAPVNGDARVRFSLYDNATSPLPVNIVGGPITVDFPAVQDGLITTTLDFGAVITGDKTFWVGMEVESPTGSGFVGIAPRQKITTTPVAGRATVATSATVAGSASQLLALSASSLLDNALYLRAPASDTNHALRWAGNGNAFAGLNVDGPALYGYLGGALGSTINGQSVTLLWDSNQRVSIGTNAFPQARLDLGGTAGTDGIRFPDGTLQTTAWRGTKGVFPVNTTNVPALGLATLTFTLPGALVTDVAVASPQVAMPYGLVVGFVRVSAPDTVSVNIQSHFNAVLPIPSGNWNIAVMH